MTEPPDYDAIARRYLDLWQDQFERMATDPALAATLGRMFSLYGTALAGLAGLVLPHEPAGTTPAAGSHGAGADGVAELASRLAEIERRLDALERTGR